MTTRMYIYYYIFYGFFRSPLGMVVLLLLVLMVCGCVMGLVDFRNKKKPTSSSLADKKQDETERANKLDTIRGFLNDELDGKFEVNYFDGAYQVFTTVDFKLSDEELYRKLRLRFPQGVFSMHRTLSVSK